MGILTSQEYWSGFPWPPPGIFLTQKSNPCLLWLLHCTRILYHWATGEVINIYKTSSSLTHKISETVKGVTVNQVFRVVLSICTCQEPLLLFFKNIFYWSTAGLHCCANVVLMFSAAHWSGLVIYVYIIYIYFFSYSFPLWFIYHRVVFSFWSIIFLQGCVSLCYTVSESLLFTALFSLPLSHL